MIDPETQRLLPEYKVEIEHWVGTQENCYFWYNTTDTTGLICSTLVFLTMSYTITVICIATAQNVLPSYHSAIILTFAFLAMWSHIKTMCSDPGAIPRNAHPPSGTPYPIPICGHCECHKTNNSHHDRVSKRCISRMDHFCPWMNNAVGAKNQKNFFLFLIYTDLASIYTYIIVALYLVDCSAIHCTPFEGYLLNMVRVLIFFLLFGILFTSSMIINQIYGLAIGLGTIDRMKLKPTDPLVGTPIPFSHVFGDSPLSWILPLDTAFTDPLLFQEVFLYQLKNHHVEVK